MGLFFGGAILLSAYSGFRLPSLWTVTQYNITVFDGILRRSVFGTLLTPLWALAGYNYKIYAIVAFMVLAGILSVAFIAVIHARCDMQRLFIIIWLIAPTGAYVFHEVGYLEQVNYLLLFLTVLLWRKGRIYTAGALASLSMFVHEAALLTVWPILTWLVVAEIGMRTKPRHLLVLAVSASIGIFLTLFNTVESAQISSLIERLSNNLPFQIRKGAITLFSKTFYETWSKYSPLNDFLTVLPFIFLIGGFWIFLYLKTTAVDKEQKFKNLLRITTAIMASCAPFLLVFGGWDVYRWIFLGLSNFVVVTFYYLQECTSDTSISRNQTVILAFILPFMLLFYIPLKPFDGISLRLLKPDAVIQEIANPSFLRFPNR
jgi:hypothetical protein